MFFRDLPHIPWGPGRPPRASHSSNWRRSRWVSGRRVSIRRTDRPARRPIWTTRIYLRRPRRPRCWSPGPTCPSAAPPFAHLCKINEVVFSDCFGASVEGVGWREAQRSKCEIHRGLSGISRRDSTECSLSLTASSCRIFKLFHKSGADIDLDYRYIKLLTILLN